MIRVLLVDDEIQTLENIKKNIEWKQLGVTYIFMAQSYNEALNIIEKYRPEIIVSDIEMPNRSGIALLRQLREQNCNIPFIFLTCHPEFEYMQSAIRLGSCDYILKPVDYSELTLALAKITKKSGNSADENEKKIEASSMVKQAKIYIENHLIEDFKVADISNYLHCSEHHLMKIFKSEYGWSIVEYITKERINKARDLLIGTDWSIQMISQMCGYDDSSYFTRIFKKITGITPSVYRKNKKGGI